MREGTKGEGRVETTSHMILQLEQLMKEAPGRRGRQFFMNQFNFQFKQNDKYLTHLMNSCSEPVKVAVMGEVKAGKSTLINSMLQRKISYMNAAEATAVIHHFVYSEKSYGKLIKKDGSIEAGSVEDIQSLIESYAGNETAIRNLEAVEFGLPLSVLKRFDLVDTPGIATVTRENEQITRNYIQRADIVLWVFNSHYIGQSNIREAVLQVMEEGKQVIGVLNRTDEVELSQEELVISAKRWIRSVSQYYPVSAYKALESMEQGESWGVTELLNGVEVSIGEEKQAAKEKAIVNSLCSLIEREISWHGQMNQVAGEISQRLVQHEEKLQAAHRELSEEAYKNYLNWLERDFMLGELNQFYQMKNDKEELLNLQEAYFKEEYISECLMNKVTQISDLLKERWVQKARSIDQELVDEIRSYVENEIEADLQAQIKLEDTEVVLSQEAAALTDEFVKGATLGTVIASLAFLGPTATQLTFIGMASSVLPVALIGGVITTIYKRNKIKSTDSRECQELYKGITRSVMHLRDELVEEAEQANPFEALSRQILETLKETVSQHVTVQDQAQLSSMEEEIREYKIKLERLKEKLLQKTASKELAHEKAASSNVGNSIETMEIDQDLLDLLG